MNKTKTTTDDQDLKFVRKITQARWLIKLAKPTKKVNWLIGIAAEILLKDYNPKARSKTASNGQDSFSFYVGPNGKQYGK